MKKVKGSKFVSFLTVGAIASSSVAIPAAMALENAPATASAAESVQLAQGLVGQCRAVKRSVFIYAERSTTSQRVRALAANEQVTLADNGGGGWIAISAPAAGFVQTAELKGCTGQPQPPQPPVSLCRQVITDLNVRDNPNTSARVIRLMRAGQQVTLKSAQEVTAADGRIWAEITGPVAGWISTRPNSSSTSNLVNCSGNPTPPPQPPSSKSCKIAFPQGLRLWNSPTGAVIGSIPFNRDITLTGQRQVIGDRVWVELSAPTRAWISSGFVGTERNISCP